MRTAAHAPRRRRRATAPLTLACALAAALGASGCELHDGLLPDLDAFDSDPCSTSRGNTTVAGEWTINGEGTRSGCDDPLYNGPFSLESSKTLSLTQSPSSSDGPDALTLASPLTLSSGGQLLLSGEISGTCVSFSAEERDAQGRAVFRYHFNGDVASSSRITGALTGSGPAGCQIEDGTFEVNLR